MNKLISDLEFKAVSNSLWRECARCNWCGKFVKIKTAQFHFIPDSVCGPEESYWECEKCK